MDESSLYSSPAGGGRGSLLGLPGGWRQLGEAAASDGGDKQTHSAPHSRVALSQPAVLGSVFWDQGTELVLPCQDPAPAVQHSGGKYVLFWSRCCTPIHFSFNKSPPNPSWLIIFLTCPSTSYSMVMIMIVLCMNWRSFKSLDIRRSYISAQDRL